MGALKRSAILGLVPLFALVSAARAQPAAPRIAYVYPAGGQQGSTFEITVGGQFLNGVSSVYVTGAGVRATVVEFVKPLNQQQVGQLRMRLQELQKPPRDPNKMEEIAEIRAKIATFQRRPAPALADTVRIQVTLAPDAEPGERELRVGTPNGLSNPRVFLVGQLPEVSRPAATNAADPNDFKGPRPPSPYQLVPGATVTPEMGITLPAVVNGQILPGGVDRYRFRATKGLRLVVAASARELIPYLADAVPGWFQAAVALYDANGSELSHADHFRYHPDPALYYEIPKDGEYVLEVRDSIYRGREDFVYRLTAGEVPYVTGIFPLGGRAGTQPTVELAGWNLPLTRFTQDAKDKTPGVYPLVVRSGKWVSNPVPFAVDSLPECLERKPNNSQEQAQPVTLPILVNGRIDRPGEWDVFRFDGRAGDEVVAEVHARRLGSPMDSVLKLTDASGRQLAYSDDLEDRGSGLDTHHADSYLRVKLPAGGTYFVHIGDAQRQGGPECAYRLRIGPPRPDFELRVAPSSINVRGGSSVPLAVCALRRDGFSGEIVLALKGAPAGFSLGGALVPANQDEVRITLVAPPMLLKEPVHLTVEGRAKIGGEQVVHEAVPAEDMMQAFAYRHLVPSRELDLTVPTILAARGPVRVFTATPIKIPAGGTARVQVGLFLNNPRGQVHLELDNAPDGITLQSVSPIPRGAEIVLRADGAKIKPGTKGNLIVSTFLLLTPPTSAPSSKPASSPATRPAAAPVVRPAVNRRRVALGPLPAIPFEIVAGDRRAGSDGNAVK